MQQNKIILKCKKYTCTTFLCTCNTTSDQLEKKQGIGGGEMQRRYVSFNIFHQYKFPYSICHNNSGGDNFLIWSHV